MVVVDEEHAARLPAASAGGPQVVVVGEQYERWLAAASDVDPRVPSSPDTVVVVLYSSGTTGLPKGIQLTSSPPATAAR